MWQSTKCPNLWLTESELRDVAHTSLIENLGGACMHSSCTGADPLPGGSQMATQEAAICNMLCGGWSSIGLVTKSAQA